MISQPKNIHKNTIMTTDTQKNGSASAAKLDFTTFHNVINGKLVSTAKTTHNVNPSTLEANPEVPVSTLDDVNEAVAHARIATKKWATVPLAERQQAICNFAAALSENADDFAHMLTKEQGKPVSLSSSRHATLRLAWRTCTAIADTFRPHLLALGGTKRSHKSCRLA